MALQQAHFTGQDVVGFFHFLMISFFSMKFFKITSNNNLLLSWYIEVKEQKADLQGHWRAENGHQKKRRKKKVNGIKSSGTSSGRYALHGIKRRMKKREKKEEEEWMRSGQRQWRFDGRDNLTRCRGCQGYMDFFSEVFCVVIFFFFNYFFFIFCTPRNTKMENIFKESTTGRTTWYYFAECSEFKTSNFP